MKAGKQLLARFLRNEHGASAMEYAIIAGLISVVCVSTLSLAGGQVFDMFDSISSAVQDAMGSS